MKELFELGKEQLEQGKIFDRFDIQKYQNEPKYSVVYSRINLPKKKARAFVINPDEYESSGTH